VARADGAFESLDDLRGRSFAFGDADSVVGHHYPRQLALGGGGLLAEAVSRSTFTQGYDDAVQRVLEGRVDAAAVDSIAYGLELARGRAFEGRLRVLHRSAAFGVGPFVVAAGITSGDERSLRQALLAMDGSPEGRAMLEQLGADRFVQVPAGHFDAAAHYVAGGSQTPARR
jgi:phosphonate transport system substrate-binding protein